MNLANIAGSLRVYFAANFTVDTDIEYPGDWLAKESLDDWVEIDIDYYPQHRARYRDDWGRLTIVARCYAKDSTNRFRIHTLATGVRETLSQARIKVYDYTASGEPRIGLLQLDEGERDDVTREFNEPVNSRVRAAIWRFRSLAEEN